MDEMVRGSAGEVNNRLHDMGDFSKAARELSIIIVALKRELAAKGEEKLELRAKLKWADARVTEVKSKMSVVAREAAELSQANRCEHSFYRVTQLAGVLVALTSSCASKNRRTDSGTIQTKS